MAKALSVAVLFFAAAAEATGCSRAVLELEGEAALSEVRRRVLEAFPELAKVSTAMALNHEYVADGEDPAVRNGDELAFIPPVSGG